MVDFIKLAAANLALRRDYRSTERFMKPPSMVEGFSVKGFGVQDLGLRARGAGLRVQGFWGQGSGFRDPTRSGMKDFLFCRQTLLEFRTRGPEVRSFEVQLLGFRRFLSSKPKPNSAGSCGFRI